MITESRHARTGGGLLDLFPTPSFLMMPAVGLDISDSAIRFVELVRRGRRYELGRFGERRLPSGAIAAGYVHDKDAVVEALASLAREHRLSFVDASLPEEKAYLFKTRIPNVDPREVRGTLEFTLEENVPIPPAEALFDYTVLKSSVHEPDHLDVAVTVLPVKVVETYIELLRAAGLAPLSFEIGAQGVGHAVVRTGDTGTSLIANLEEEKTGLYIVSAENVLFTSTVPIGGSSITRAIAKYFSVSLEEARQLKEEKGFIRNRKNTELFLPLMNTIAALRDEIHKLSVYWETHKPGGEAEEKIGTIILSGRDAGLAGFDEYLASTLKIGVSVANVWQNAFAFEEYVPPMHFRDSLGYAAAIGLALPKDRS